jgi:hypothetical protein
MLTPIIYLGFAGLGIGLVFLGLLLGALGGGHHAGDGGTDLDGDGLPDGIDLDGDGVPDLLPGGEPGGLSAGLSFLSMTGLGALLVGFGALGYLGASMGLKSLLAVPLGLAGSIGTFWLTGRLRLILIRHLQTGRSTGAMDLVHLAAEVTVPVPPQGKGVGQAVVWLQGRPHYVRVSNPAPDEIAKGAWVVLMEPVDGIYPAMPMDLEQRKG